MAYNTKQKEMLVEYLKSTNGGHITISDITKYFISNDMKIGVATLYRHMDKLVLEGKVKKYMLDGETSAYYEYIDNHAHCHSHHHFKCECCGKLIHFECDMLSDISEHLAKEHGFDVNSLKTTFYGKCDKCANK